MTALTIDLITRPDAGLADIARDAHRVACLLRIDVRVSLNDWTCFVSHTDSLDAAIARLCSYGGGVTLFEPKNQGKGWGE